MKLIQFRKPGPPGVLQCLDVPVPEPKPGEVLIRAHAIGVGIPDVLIRSGTYGFMPPLPATPGTEISGLIEKVGPGVTSCRPGERVYATARERPHRGGHYAEYIATPADATFLLPERIDLDAAAALANYQVAYHIFNDAVRPRKGQSVLIYAAAGGMGNALIDLAKPMDLVVIGVVSSEEKAHFARELGVDHVINRKNEKVGKRIDEITNGRGVDIIIDPVAEPTIPDNIALLAPCGMLIIYGAKFPVKFPVSRENKQSKVLTALGLQPASPGPVFWSPKCATRPAATEHFADASVSGASGFAPRFEISEESLCLSHWKFPLCRVGQWRLVRSCTAWPGCQ